MPKPETPTHIGANIRTARTNKPMTQLALAHAIGWTGKDAGAQISRFESGENEPRLSTLQRISVELGVTLESLLKQPAKKKK